MDAASANPLPSAHGVWCAVLTPFDEAGLPDFRRLTQHVRRIFAAGVDGIALFGTTGEGQSLSLHERRAGLDAMLAGGIAPERIMAATGCASLPETIELVKIRTRQFAKRQMTWFRRQHGLEWIELKPADAPETVVAAMNARMNSASG